MFHVLLGICRKIWHHSHKKNNKNNDNQLSPSRLSRPWTLDRALRRSAGLMSTLDRRLTRGPASSGSAEETGAAVLREGGGRAAAGGLSADGDTRSGFKHTGEGTHCAPLRGVGTYLCPSWPNSNCSGWIRSSPGPRCPELTRSWRRTTRAARRAAAALLAALFWRGPAWEQLELEWTVLGWTPLGPWRLFSALLKKSHIKLDYTKEEL